VKLAILRELQREGQVYFVHNRVHNITRWRTRFSRWCRTRASSSATGRWATGEMEEAMLKFIRHEADILVCTTIIEIGLDIPNATRSSSTTPIGSAERAAPASRPRRAVEASRVLLSAAAAGSPVTPVAAKRLKAIEEYSHLGAGSRSRCATWKSAAPATSSGRSSRAHRDGRLRDVLPAARRSRAQVEERAEAATPEAHVEIGVSAFIPKTVDRRRPPAHGRLPPADALHERGHAEHARSRREGRFGDPPRQAVLLLR
jgi:transcription-repair coupling factor (superfamily II helicase)